VSLCLIGRGYKMGGLCRMGGHRHMTTQTHSAVVLFISFLPVVRGCYILHDNLRELLW
jgi:hypothetical protein